MLEVLGFFILLGVGIFAIGLGGFAVTAEVMLGERKPIGSVAVIAFGIALICGAVYLSPFKVVIG